MIEVILILSTFVTISVLAQIKKKWHWKYLKEVDPELKQFEKIEQLSDNQFLSRNKEINQLLITIQLLLPYVKISRYHKTNDNANEYYS